MSKKVTLSENALKVAESRYFMPGEDWEKCALRVATSISAAENGKQEEYRDKFFEMIYNMDFLPGGRILRNAGRPRGTLFNCFHLPIGDSIEEIGQFYKDALVLWSDGGGVGCNFTSLRPKGDAIAGKGGNSSGLVSFIEAADNIAKTIESGGARRAAALASVDVSHPEILDFIDAKTVHNKMSHFNISVSITEDFLSAVESDSEWELKFKQKSYGKIKARLIWDKIINNMVKWGEPGILNWNNLSKNNSYYYDPVRGTNPCGEAVLAPYDVCDLGSLVLPNFITGSVNTNWQKQKRLLNLGVRFLDDIIDVNKYSINEISIKAHNSRRIGVGVMGLAEYLFAKEARYGSEKALLEVERLMRFIRDTVYEALVELAVEKGAFPKFDPVSYGKASFIRKLPASLRMDIKEKGVRCVTAMAFAPTGTTSLLPEVSSGIEPLIAKAYRRQDRVGQRIYIHPKYKHLITTAGEIPEWFVDAKDLTPKDHFETQCLIQKYVDGAVSKTINMPRGTTVEQLDKLLLEYVKDVKGVTIYVDGSREVEGQVYMSMTEEEVIDWIVNNPDGILSNFSEEDIECNCQKPTEEK